MLGVFWKWKSRILLCFPSHPIKKSTPWTQGGFDKPCFFRFSYTERKFLWDNHVRARLSHFTCVATCHTFFCEQSCWRVTSCGQKCKNRTKGHILNYVLFTAHNFKNDFFLVNSREILSFLSVLLPTWLKENTFGPRKWLWHDSHEVSNILV